MEETRCPKIGNLEKITKEEAIAYIKFVAALRHQQRRFLTFRKPEILESCRFMEKQLDELNAYLLTPTSKLF